MATLKIPPPVRERPVYLPSSWFVRQITALIQIMRPHNCLGAMFAALLGNYLANHDRSLSTLLALPVGIAVALVVAGSNVVNDLVDQPVDQLNKPGRPLPSGKISPRAAKLLAAFLILSALVIAAFLGARSLAFAFLAALLGIGYSLFLKSTVLLGNGMVGFLSGLTIIYGATMAGSVTAEASWASWLVFLFVFMREILKSVADRESDAQIGLTTVATEFGQTVSMRLFQVFAGLYVLFAVAPWLLRLASGRYLWSIVLFSILPTVVIVVLLGLCFTDLTVRLALRSMKILWFTGLLALAFL